MHYKKFQQKIRGIYLVLAIFYMPYGMGMQPGDVTYTQGRLSIMDWVEVLSIFRSKLEKIIQVPLIVDNQGHLSTGCLIRSSSHRSYMGWVEVMHSMLAKEHQHNLANSALSKMIQQFSMGSGLGYQINATHVLKAYLYIDFTHTFLQGSIPLADRDLEYGVLISGFEMQTPRYRISANVNGNHLIQGLWQEARSGPSDPKSPDYDIGLMEYKPAIRRYYFDLFRHRLDLIERAHWGFNSQVQWNYSDHIRPYVGAYYNRVDFQIPIACYQYFNSNFKLATVPIGYDFQFSKNILGLQFGFQYCFRYLHFDARGMIDNFSGWQGTATLKVPSLLGNNISSPQALRAYHSPMLHIGPTSYARTITTDQWKRAENQKSKWFIPFGRKIKKWQLEHTTRMTPQLTFQGRGALLAHILKMAAYHEHETHSLEYLKISSQYLKSYLQQIAANTVIPENFTVRLDWSRIFPTRILSIDTRGRSSYLLQNFAWHFVEKALYDNSFEDLKGNADFAQLTQGETAEQLQGIQFFMNAAHLFHTLDPGSAVGIIHLARGDLRFRVENPRNTHPVYKALPSEINATIIDYLLLEKSRVEQILDQRYHDKPQEIAMMRKTIIDTV